MPNYWEEELQVLSAENVNFVFDTAGLGSRFMAVFIDIVIQMLVYLFLVFLGIRYLDLLMSSLGGMIGSRYLERAFVILFLFLLFYAYFFLFEWLWHGMTPGKRLLGLRVMSTDGLPATFWQVLVRNVLRLVDFLPALYGVGAVAVIFNDENRRVGDLAAGTIVVRERSEEVANKILSIHDAAEAFLAAEEDGVSVNSTKVSTNIAGSSLRPQISAQISTEESEMVRDFLLRRETLRPTARKRLAALLAGRLARTLQWPLPSEEQMESFLEYIATKTDDEHSSFP